MKKKITLIDVLIIAVVIIAAIVLLRFAIGGGGESTKTISYKVLVTDKLPEVAQQIVAADNVLLDSKENKYGKVTFVELSPAEESYFDSKNERYVSRTTEERMDVYTTVEAEAIESESGWKIGEQNIKIGETQNISAAGYGVTGYIIDIMN